VVAFIDPLRRHTEPAHLGAGSRSSYCSGWRAWQWYATVWSIPVTIFTHSIAVAQLAVEAFIYWLRSTRQLKQATLTGYVSHIADHLRTLRIAAADHLRSSYTAQALTAMHNLDLVGRPHRLTCKIPIGPSLIQLVLAKIRTKYSAHPAIALQLSAAVVFAYGICLRSGETAAPSGSGPLADHAIRAGLVVFQWNGDLTLYPVCQPHNFPLSSPPHRVITLQDTQKNHRLGTGPRGIPKNERADALSTFCVPTILYAYVTSQALNPDDHLFPAILPTHITAVIQEVGRDVGLDATRMCAHGIRAGSASSALRAAPAPAAHSIAAHGQWRSAQGAQPYAHTGPEHGDHVAPLLYDVSYPSIAYLKWYYGTPFHGNTHV
jgi:hypothetical protein